MESATANRFDIPDWLFALGPVSNLLFNQDTPQAPNLSDVGLGEGDIKNFFGLKRAIGRAGIQRQGATAARTAAANLPASLQQSTVPASISAGIQTKIGDQLAGFESEILGQEMQAKFSLYDAMLKQFDAQMRSSESKRGGVSDALETLSYIPLLL